MVDWYLEPKDYQGALAIDEFSIPVAFAAGIDWNGEAKIAIKSIPLSSASSFLDDYFFDQKTSFAEFTLTGISVNGASFESVRTLIYSPGHFFSDGAPATITPKVGCLACKFVEVVPVSTSQSVKLLLRDFINFRDLRAATPLGAVEMVGANVLKAEGGLSGHIEIVCPPSISDSSGWREQVSEFFVHARSVMSFARGARLQAPVMEWIADDRVELEVVSQTSEKGGTMAPFSPFDQVDIFRTAVESHLNPGPNAGGLRVAIEWFNMHSDYREGKLIAAMTVLENLVSANLRNKDMELRPKAQFRELKRELLVVVEGKIEEWISDPGERSAALAAIQDKFGDLNRRSLKQKIDLLATRWGVDLGDIDAKDIATAKRARDHIVHRGHFHPGGEVDANLMDHVRLTRELVVRSILAGLGFEGIYNSHVGGVHARLFANGVSKPITS